MCYGELMKKEKVYELMLLYRSSMSACSFDSGAYESVISYIRRVIYVGAGVSEVAERLETFGICFYFDPKNVDLEGYCVSFVNSRGFPVILCPSRYSRLDIVYLYLFRALCFVYDSLFVSVKDRFFVDKLTLDDIVGERYAVKLYLSRAICSPVINVKGVMSELDAKQVSAVSGVPTVFVIGAKCALSSQKWLLNRKNKWARHWIHVRGYRHK